MKFVLVAALSLLVGCNNSNTVHYTNGRFFCTPDGHATWHIQYVSAGVTAPMLTEEGHPVSCEVAKQRYPDLYEVFEP